MCSYIKKQERSYFEGFLCKPFSWLSQPSWGFSGSFTLFSHLPPTQQDYGSFRGCKTPRQVNSAFLNLGKSNDVCAQLRHSCTDQRCSRQVQESDFSPCHSLLSKDKCWCSPANWHLSFSSCCQHSLGAQKMMLLLKWETLRSRVESRCLSQTASHVLEKHPFPPASPRDGESV